MAPTAQNDTLLRASAGSGRRHHVWWALAVWCALALAGAAVGVLAYVSPYALPLLIWAPVLTVAALLWMKPAIRAAVNELSLWAMVVFHAIRLPIGVAFLIQQANGLLAREFAQLAGYGDIAVGLLAIPASFLARRPTRGRLRLVALWNALALLDILVVFVTAQRVLLFGGGPAAMTAFFLFPGPMIPLFVVPLVLITHGLIAWRCRSVPG